MAQIQQLLKYQEADSRLLKVEQETLNCDERKKFVQTKNFLTKASEKLDQLEGKANELERIMDGLQKKYDEAVETLKDFENLDELVESGADVSFYKRNAMQISELLKGLKNEITALTKAIKASGVEYQELKKKVLEAQKQYPVNQAAYQEYKKSRQVEVDKIKSELDALAKDIDPEILKRYNNKRSERIFPIICALNGDRCPKCGMELSIAGKERVSGGGVIECENCHRFLCKL